MGRDLNILLVEDNEGDIRLIREAFSERCINYDFSLARDGEEALNYLYRRGEFKEAVKPDIILLDINLPKINGFEILQKIKEDPELRRIPVIIISSSSSQEHIYRSYDLRANSYLTKPSDFDEYIDVVKTIEDFWFNKAQLPSD
jgi:chemotaxis family two-component system response regulator Rcp1